MLNLKNMWIEVAKSLLNTELEYEKSLNDIKECEFQYGNKNIK